MSDVELGGGTAFINVGALVEPRKVSVFMRTSCNTDSSTVVFLVKSGRHFVHVVQVFSCLYIVKTISS